MNSRVRRSALAFTLVEILISIMILALGLLGLGVLFPVVIREQRLGVDASTGVIVAGTAKDVLTTPQYSRALPSAALDVTPADPPPPPLPAPQPPAQQPGACCSPVNSPVCSLLTKNQCNAQTGHFYGEGVACGAVPCTLSHPAIVDRGIDGATAWMWEMLRDRESSAAAPAAVIPDGLGQGYSFASPMSSFQKYGQGEWFTRLVEPATGTAKIGFPNSPALVAGPTRVSYGTKVNFYTACADLPVQQRLYPQSATIDPQFVWDFAVQRVSHFNYYRPPDGDDLRAVVFVRRIDSRIRPTGTAKSILDAIANVSGTVANADRRLPVGEDANGNPTFDGTDGSGGLRYSGIHSCEVEFWYNPNIPAQNHTDRLYIPTALVTPTSPAVLTLLFAQMKQPGQKLVDNLGNIYTVIGSGNEPGVNAQNLDGVPGADYIRVDPPVPVSQDRAAPLAQGTTYTASGGEIRRAIWQVSFTPQVPVAVTIVDLLRRYGQ